ncbi:pyridoxal 5'-phosphate synthase [Flavobacteriaceae bacterium UJ101]|nr:pyridoxal 5'-phosphate synthase [Flavobacteriaceae bacterium UJ101]
MNIQDLSDYRQNYTKEELLEEHLKESPIEQFQKWFYEVEETGGITEVNAMTISTNGQDGFPKSRIVLLKKTTWEGFIFYTNYLSEKGLAIEKNPKICLSFFWPVMERQVIIKGVAEKLPQNLSDGYFEQRPRGSQLGAWASQQSTVVPNKAFLENSLKELEAQYEGKEIPRPSHWGGYLVKPQSVEFWQGRPNRMHDRIRYTLQEDFSWKIERLAP